MNGIMQYYRTIGNIWVTLYSKHQLRDSDITLDRVYNMLAEFLIELKLNEEQHKITQIATGSSGSQVKLSAYDYYIVGRQKARKTLQNCLGKEGFA